MKLVTRAVPPRRHFYIQATLAPRVAARRFLLLAIWIGFLGDLIVGAGLLISRDDRLNAIGLAMVLGAVAVMVGFTLYYYVQQRRTRGA